MARNKRISTGPQEHRIRYSDDLLWGVHPILEILKTQPERVLELFLQKDKHGKTWQEIIDSARDLNIKYSFVERIKIIGSPEQINHQGVVARNAPVPLISLDDLLLAFKRGCENGATPKVIACDSIQDPHNLGAIIRSAHAGGVNQVIVTRDRSARLGGTAAKASAGAISRVQICQVTNLAEALKKLKDAGGWIFGAVKEEQAQSIYQTDFKVPACLVVGNEGSGIRPLVKRHCDVLVSIPMAGEIDSLNSSVAAAVIVFEMLRQSLN